jgi:hypothetical protein
MKVVNITEVTPVRAASYGQRLAAASQPVTQIVCWQPGYGGV